EGRHGLGRRGLLEDAPGRQHAGMTPARPESMTMQRFFGLSVGVIVALVLAWSTAASAQAPPGATADERAVTGAKAYMKAKGLTSLKLNMMMPPSSPRGARWRWRTSKRRPA